MTMRDRVINDASNVVTGHGMLGEICVVAWMEGGNLKVLAQQGHDEAAALMLYRAADVFADRVPLTNAHVRDQPDD